MRATDTLVEMLTAVLPSDKIYPQVVPPPVGLPYAVYTESAEPSPTYDGNGGDVVTTTVSVFAATKAEAARLADRVVEVLDGAQRNGYAFYFQGPRGYRFFDAERISNYDLTFSIL